jgi:hypothetical protein
MRGKRMLGWMVAMALLLSCAWLVRDVDAWRAGIGTEGGRLLLALIAGYPCFLWYVADSDERGFRRPRWLGAAMILLTPLAVPWYLVRTRAGSARAQALLGYAGCVGLCALSAWGAALLRFPA